MTVWIAFLRVLKALQIHRTLVAYSGLRYSSPSNSRVRAPSLRFWTRIYHPDIDSRRQICLSILDNDWNPNLTISTALPSVLSLLSDPDLADPLVPEIAEIYCKDYNLYCHNAKTYTARYPIAESA